MGQISQEGNLLPQMSLNWYQKCHSCDHIFRPRIKLRGAFVPSCVVHDRFNALEVDKTLKTFLDLFLAILIEKPENWLTLATFYESKEKSL